MYRYIGAGPIGTSFLKYIDVLIEKWVSARAVVQFYNIVLLYK